MKLIVFGATGGTGQQVIEQALARGHQVTAVARNPQAITVTSPNLQIAQGDVMQPASLTPLLAGQDAVISALGTRTARGATTLYSDGTRHILQAMAEQGARRLLAVAAGAYVNDPADVFLSRYVVKPLLNRILRGIYADMQRMEALIKASNTAWTIVRPARLTDGPRTGQYRAVADRAIVNGWTISRADMADYILTHLADENVFQAAISLAY